jgi:hypothetical protein
VTVPGGADKWIDIAREVSLSTERYRYEKQETKESQCFHG